MYTKHPSIQQVTVHVARNKFILWRWILWRWRHWSQNAPNALDRWSLRVRARSRWTRRIAPKLLGQRTDQVGRRCHGGAMMQDWNRLNRFRHLYFDSNHDVEKTWKDAIEVEKRFFAFCHYFCPFLGISRHSKYFEIRLHLPSDFVDQQLPDPPYLSRGPAETRHVENTKQNKIQWHGQCDRYLIIDLV